MITRDGTAFVLLLMVRQRPNLNFSNFKWVQHLHGNGVGSLVCQMPADARAELLVGLPDVDRFTIVIIKGVHPEFEVAQTAITATVPVCSLLVQE